MADIGDYADILAEPQLRAWSRVARIARSRGGTLMGGTAVAVHLRHRFSEDLDIMTLGKFPGTAVAMQLGQEFANVNVVDVWDNSCRALVDGVRVDVFTAPQRVSVGPHGIGRVAEDIEVCGMPVGSLPDLLATKLEIIRFRSKLRDYIDLYAIDTLSGYSLEDGIGFYCRRFGHDELPHDFNDTLKHLADAGTLPDDPQFNHLKEEVLEHLSSRAAALRQARSQPVRADGSAPAARTVVAGEVRAAAEPVRGGPARDKPRSLRTAECGKKVKATGRRCKLAPGHRGKCRSRLPAQRRSRSLQRRRRPTRRRRR